MIFNNSHLYDKKHINVCYITRMHSTWMTHAWMLINLGLTWSLRYKGLGQVLHEWHMQSTFLFISILYSNRSVGSLILFTVHKESLTLKYSSHIIVGQTRPLIFFLKFISVTNWVVHKGKYLIVWKREITLLSKQNLDEIHPKKKGVITSRALIRFPFSQDA